MVWWLIQQEILVEIRHDRDDRDAMTEIKSSAYKGSANFWGDLVRPNFYEKIGSKVETFFTFHFRPNNFC